MTGIVRKVDLDPPAEVVWIARRLEDAGFETWAVGGAVRDALAGQRPGDWDLTTAARPGDVRRLFRRTVPLGVEHGTVGIVGRSGQMYEVTTFRRDVETFGRRARVVFADRLEDDLDRRDFTMNAVAWHPLSREVRDPHGGMSDLAAGLLRTVGDPTLRFAEDRLRVLRGLRFAGRFGLRIEDETWTATVASSDKLGELSAERVRDELLKVLTGQRKPSSTLTLYAKSGVLRSLYPELDASREVAVSGTNGNLWEISLRSADAASIARPRVRLAALLHGTGSSGSLVASDDARQFARSAAMARALMHRLRFSNADNDVVSHLIAQQAPVPRAIASRPELVRWLRLVGRDHINNLLRLLIAKARGYGEGPDQTRELRNLHARIATILQSQPVLEVGDLAIDGSDLRDAGYPPGPIYGEILRYLLERVTDEPSLNDRDTLLKIASDESDRMNGQ